MGRYVQFVTPENIEVSYELAGIGSRFIAALVDHVLQVVIVVAAGFLVGRLLLALSLVSGGGYLQEALFTIIAFLVMFGYFVFFELLWAGRTPGKRWLGLRTVRDGGYPVDTFSTLVRNLVRWVDFLPLLYGAGLFSIFFSGEYKRLGDWAAGTLVIKERDPRRVGGRGGGPASPIVAHYLGMVKNVDGLTAEDYNTIRRFVERRNELTIPIQAHIAMRLARPLVEKLGLQGIPIQVQWHYADLLEAIERRYVSDHGVLNSPVDLFAPLEL